MTYSQLLSLNLAHAYYPDGVCPDFTIEPTSSTARLLANYRCVLKSGPGWLRLYNDTTLLQPAQGDVLRFHLRLENPDFGLFTDLSGYAAVVAPAFVNDPPDPGGKLTLTSMPERQQERFAWESAGGSGRFKLGGQPLAGAASRLEVDGAGAGAKAEYDAPENAVAITGASAKVGDPVTVSYDAQPAPRPGVFAEAEIRLGGGNQPSLGDFRVEFQPKQAYWAYYLVTNLKDDAGAFSIKENPAGTDQALGFSSSTTLDLDKSPDPADTVAAGLKALDPGVRLIRFVSGQPVPCRRSARPNVQLFLGSNQLAAPLPNPAPARFTTVADPTGDVKPRLGAWYQVLRHLTR
jgi:hypothetical protein